MKKIFIIIIAFLLCSCNNNTSARNEVYNYLDDFKNLNSNVKEEVEYIINSNVDYTLEQKKLYKDILYREYKSLKYDVISEEYDGDKALIKVNINVIDLNKAEEESLDYLSENLKEFYNEENIFDNEKYLSYKLNLMKKTTKSVDYEIIFYLEFRNGKWHLEQPTDSDLEKIHGIYKEEN